MKICIVLILLICLVSILFVGCEETKTRAGDTSVVENNIQTKIEVKTKDLQKKPQLIACIVNQNDQYMKLLQLGMTDAAKKIGANVILSNTYGKLNREIELINMYIKSGVDGICIHPVSVDLSEPILRKAKQSGIKVISAGISIPDKFQIGYIESDQWELGKKTGEACKEFIEKNLNGKANIAILNYKSQFQEESTKRTDGFKTEVTKLQGVKIVTEQEAWLSETSTTQARSIISSHPDLNIIWAANEGGTVGAVIAVKNSGKAGRLFVFGTDVSEQLLNMLLNKDNILQSITGQQPYLIGYQAIEQLSNDIKGEHPRGKVIMPGIPLSRNNLNVVNKYIEDFKDIIGAN